MEKKIKKFIKKIYLISTFLFLFHVYFEYSLIIYRNSEIIYLLYRELLFNLYVILFYYLSQYIFFII